MGSPMKQNTIDKQSLSMEFVFHLGLPMSEFLKAKWLFVVSHESTLIMRKQIDMMVLRAGYSVS